MDTKRKFNKSNRPFTKGGNSSKNVSVAAGGKDKEKDFFSKIFTGHNSEDDSAQEDLSKIHNNPYHQNQPRARRGRPMPKQDVSVKSNHKKMAETISPRTIVSGSSKSNPSGRPRGVVLAPAESDSDDDAKPEGDFEFDDSEGDDDEEPEIVGVGKSFSGSGKPKLGHDFHDEVEVKEELDQDEEDQNEEDQDDNIEDGDCDAFQAEVDAERTGIRKELANLTYEELEALKQKMGLSLYNEAMFGTKAKKHLSKKKQMQLYKRENKNRPREISSRVRVPRVREVVHVKKVVKRDPRFEESCGELNKDIWDKNYEFLREMQQKEVQDLKKSLKNVEDDQKRMEIKQYIQTFKNKEKSKSVKDKEIQKRKLEKEENLKRMAEGKNPFYIKKSTRKFMDLAEKYEELKSSGKLEKYLKKKRKKNQTRDRKTITTN